MTSTGFVLTILGSGTGVPLPERQAPGLVIQAGGIALLFDSGSGAAYQLAKSGLLYHQFDHLFYTHYAHPDHVNDLVELIFANEYFDPRRQAPLRVYGPVGMGNFLERLKNLYPILGRVSYPIEVQELDRGQVIIGDLGVSSQPLEHQQNACVGYRIEHQGKSVVYTGDTDYCESLVALAKQADLLVTECSFPNWYKVKGHLTAGEVGEVARQAGVKKVILTHLYPYCDQTDVVAEVNEKFSGKVVKAEDLMRVVI